MGSAYLAALEAYPHLYEPEAHDLWDADDVPALAEDVLGRMLLGVDLDDLGGFDVATGDGGKYVELRTRLGRVYGSGFDYPLALASALAAYAELVARSRLTIVPIERKRAFDFVRAVHRHHPVPPAGDRFRFGAFARVNDFDTLVGVAIVGNPESRHLQAEGAWEVTRVAVLEGGQNLASALYTAAWKEAARRGVARLVTYTLPSEGGASLRAAGWHVTVEKTKGGSWDRPSRPRSGRGPTCPKTRWEHIAKLRTAPADIPETFTFQQFIAAHAKAAARAYRRAEKAAEQGGSQ